MILYLDSSALVKRYFKEAFTDEVLDKWRNAEAVVTSAVAYAETLSAIYRKNRESKLDEGTLLQLIQVFQSEWDGLIRIQVTDELNKYIDMAFQTLLSDLMVKSPKKFFDNSTLLSNVL